MHKILIMCAAVLREQAQNPHKDLCAFGKETAG